MSTSDADPLFELTSEDVRLPDGPTSDATLIAETVSADQAAVLMEHLINLAVTLELEDPGAIFYSIAPPARLRHVNIILAGGGELSELPADMADKAAELPVLTVGEHGPQAAYAVVPVGYTGGAHPYDYALGGAAPTDAGGLAVVTHAWLTCPVDDDGTVRVDDSLRVAYADLSVADDGRIDALSCALVTRAGLAAVGAALLRTDGTVVMTPSSVDDPRNPSGDGVSGNILDVLHRNLGLPTAPPGRTIRTLVASWTTLAWNMADERGSAAAAAELRPDLWAARIDREDDTPINPNDPALTSIDEDGWDLLTSHAHEITDLYWEAFGRHALHQLGGPLISRTVSHWAGGEWLLRRVFVDSADVPSTVRRLAGRGAGWRNVARGGRALVERADRYVEAPWTPTPPRDKPSE